MKRVILVGSPRTEGRSVALADTLFEENIDRFPEDELFLVPISEIEVGPCIGCNACRGKTEVILKGEDGGEQRVMQHRCVFDDDMQAVYDLLNDAEELVVVCPVYFSGTPSQFKCLLDRMQPYFWERVEGDGSDDEEGNGLQGAEAGAHAYKAVPKRPLVLHVVGEGGDPHGYDALVSEMRSAFAVAGFKLERVLDWVGRISEDGTIVAEAEERIFEKPAAAVGSAKAEQKPSRQRPKLDLSGSQGDGGPASKGGSKSGKSSANPGKSGKQGKAKAGNVGSGKAKAAGKGGKSKGGRRG